MDYFLIVLILIGVVIDYVVVYRSTVKAYKKEVKELEADMNLIDYYLDNTDLTHEEVECNIKSITSKYV